MKKIATFFSALLISFIGYSQSTLAVLDSLGNDVSGTVYQSDIPSNSNSTIELLIYNSGSQPISVKCERTIYVKAPTDNTQFCWGGNCYPFYLNLSTDATTIGVGDTADYEYPEPSVFSLGFHAIFNAQNATITRLVHYTFFDENNPTDSVGVTIQYNHSLGIQELGKTSGTISNAYPNPANSIVSFKYDMNESSNQGQIVFYDMLGKSVKVVQLTDKKGMVKVNIDDLNDGIYFYSLSIGGKAISTKKLIVRKE